MESLLGNSIAVFIGLTLVIAGGASWMMGQTLGATWRPAWQILIYGALLGATNRFLAYGLFGGELLSLSAYLIDTAVLIGLAGIAYRVTRVRKMVMQYPWIYEATGPFNWRKKAGAGEG